jgi:hypothetical protein
MLSVIIIPVRVPPEVPWWQIVLAYIAAYAIAFGVLIAIALCVDAYNRHQYEKRYGPLVPPKTSREKAAAAFAKMGAESSERTQWMRTRFPKR